MPGPSKLAERILALFVPPNRREEVMGDLYERYRSPEQYALDCLCTIPLVLASEVRRQADPFLLLDYAVTLYAAFAGAEFLRDSELIRTPGGFVQLLAPVGIVTLLATILTPYIRSARRPRWGLLVWIEQAKRTDWYVAGGLVVVIVLTASLGMTRHADATGRRLIGAALLLTSFLYTLIKKSEDAHL